MDEPGDPDVQYAEVYIEYHDDIDVTSGGVGVASVEVTSGEAEVTSGEVDVISGAVNSDVIKVEDEPEFAVLEPRQVPEFVPSCFTEEDVETMEFEEHSVPPSVEQVTISSSEHVMSVDSPPLTPIDSDIVTEPPDREESGEMFASAAPQGEECTSPHAAMFEGDDTPLNKPVKEIKEKWKLLPAFLQVRRLLAF